MLLVKEREAIVTYGKKLEESGLVVGTGGNISWFDRKQGHMAITPSGREYHELTLESIVVVDLQGDPVEGEGKPSSEWRMHAEVYSHRNDISAVVHTHSPNATALACMELGLPAFYYLMAIAGGDVRCAPYATFGSTELAVAVREGMEGRSAVLMARHGLLAGAGRLDKAFSIARYMEAIAGIYLTCLSAGKDPGPMPEDEIERLKELFKAYQA